MHLLWKNVHIYAHFKIKVLVFFTVKLCKFWIDSPLSDMCLANIFSHATACLFILLTISFAIEAFFSFM